MKQDQRGDKPLTGQITLEEACLKRGELKKQGIAYPTIMSIPGTPGKYYIIEGRAAKKSC